uniref:Putative secreted protein n=1 Tax=Xenopsylla cheopis TaxID=163159 RepID=A0A6M2DXT4_XENCH
MKFTIVLVLLTIFLGAFMVRSAPTAQKEFHGPHVDPKECCQNCCLEESDEALINTGLVQEEKVGLESGP